VISESASMSFELRAVFQRPIFVEFPPQEQVPMMTAGATICVVWPTFSSILAVISSTLCESFMETLLDIYRAVPRGRFRAGEVIGRKEGRRLSGNVPYFLGNLWELTLPDHLPSRRHALNASPPPELALQNASAPAPDRHMACGLSSKSRRCSIDCQCRTLVCTRTLEFSKSTSIEGSLTGVALHCPGNRISPHCSFPEIAKSELASAMAENDLFREIVTTARGLITFWNSNQSTTRPTVN
jgi:hypothetical protein